MTPTLRSSIFIKPSILQKTLFDYFSLAKDLVANEAISKRSFEDKLIYSFNNNPLRVVQMIIASTVLVMFVVHVHPHPILNRLRPSFFRLVLYGLILGGLIDIVANMQPYVLDEAETKATALENIRSSLTFFATSQSSIALMFFISILLVSSQFRKSYGTLPNLIVVGLGLLSVAQFAPTLALLIALTSHDVFEEFLPHIRLLWSASKGEKDDVEAADSTTSLADVADASVGSDSSPIHSLLRDAQRLGHVALIIGGLSLMKSLTQHGSDSLSSMASTTAMFLVWFQITQLAVREVTDQGTSLQRIRSLIRSLFVYVGDEENDGGDDFNWKTVKSRVSVSTIHGFFRRVKAFGTNVMTEVRDNLAAFEPAQVAEDEAEVGDDEVEGEEKGEVNNVESACVQQERMASTEPLVSSKKKRRSSSPQRGKRPRRRQALKRKIQQQRRRRLKSTSELNELHEIDTSSHRDAEALLEFSEDIEAPSVDTEEGPLRTVDADDDNFDEDGHVEPMSSVKAIEEEENDQGEGRRDVSLDADRQQDDASTVDHVSKGSDHDDNMAPINDNSDGLTRASPIEETDVNESCVTKDEEEEEDNDEDGEEEDADRDDEGDKGTAGETAANDRVATESVSSQSTPSNVSTSIDDENESDAGRADVHDEQEPSSVETCDGTTDDGDADLVDDSDVDDIDATAESEAVQITDEDEAKNDGETEGVVVDDPAADEVDNNDNDGDNFADVDTDGRLSSDSEHLVGPDDRKGAPSDEVETTETSPMDACFSPLHTDDEPVKEHEQPPDQQVGDDWGPSDEVADATVDDVVMNDQDAADDEEADYVYEYEYEYEYEDGEPATPSTAPGHPTMHNTTTTTTTQANDGFAPSLFVGDDAGPWPQ